MTDNLHYTPQRRWFQFRLRTLLVIMTLASVPCAWASYSLKWIADRHRALESGQFRTSMIWDDRIAPASLRIFGEEGLWSLSVFGDSPLTIDEVKRLFPEAKVVEGREEPETGLHLIINQRLDADIPR